MHVQFYVYIPIVLCLSSNYHFYVTLQILQALPRISQLLNLHVSHDCILGYWGTSKPIYLFQPSKPWQNTITKSTPWGCERILFTSHHEWLGPHLVGRHGMFGKQNPPSCTKHVRWYIPSLKRTVRPQTPKGSRIVCHFISIFFRCYVMLVSGKGSEKYHIFEGRIIQGSMILPTQTRHYCMGNPSNLPYIYIV